MLLIFSGLPVFRSLLLSLAKGKVFIAEAALLLPEQAAWPCRERAKYSATGQSELAAGVPGAIARTAKGFLKMEILKSY